MADFESIIKKHVNSEGNIPADSIGTVVTAVKEAVGGEYVAKKRYESKLTELENLKEKLQDAEDSVKAAEQWKSKFEAEEQKFNDYKAEQDAKETRASKETAYKELLKEVGIADKWTARALKGVAFDDLELDDKGKIKNVDKLKESIKTEWGDCIVTEGTQGAETSNPPANDGKEGGKGPSRAAQIAAKYHADLYGGSEGKEN